MVAELLYSVIGYVYFRPIGQKSGKLLQKSEIVAIFTLDFNS